MTALPENIEMMLRSELRLASLQAHGENVLHQRSRRRGGLLRLPVESVGSVVVKYWNLSDTRSRVKSMLRLSNGRREWAMHRFVHRSGLRVPSPIGFVRVDLTSNQRVEAMVIEDLGETVSGLRFLKDIIAKRDPGPIEEFESKVIDITVCLLRMGVLDIDHQLNNFLLDRSGQMYRIDFECAARHCSLNLRRCKLATMLARLIVSHAYASQPEVRRSECFAEKLFTAMKPSLRVRNSTQVLLDRYLENQRARTGIVTSVRLPA